MKKILVAVDGSTGSFKAMKVAKDIAKKTGATLTLISVLDSDTFISQSRFGGDGSIILEKNKKMIDELLEELKKEFDDSGLNFNTLSKIGCVEKEIVEEAKNGYDLIVIGSRGLSKLKRTFLGSISNKVVNTSTVSTLVVKEYEELSKILVAIDGSNNSKRALFLAEELGRCLEADLILLNVIQKPQVVKKDAGSNETMPSQVSQEGADLLVKEYAKKIDGYPRDITLQTKVGSPAHTITNYAEDNDINMIVMGSRGLGRIMSTFMGSVSNEVLNTTKKSCLIIK